jgi:hypothetical protein
MLSRAWGLGTLIPTILLSEGLAVSNRDGVAPPLYGTERVIHWIWADSGRRSDPPLVRRLPRPTDRTARPNLS